MTKFLSVMAMGLMLAAAGCNKSAETAEGSAEAGSTDAAMTDACSHCAGVQKATADGKCPKCGMPVATSRQ
jgi:hypothetical protein